MVNQLAKFLSLVRQESLISCELEFTYDIVDSWYRPRAQKREFLTYDAFMSFLVFLQSQDHTLLSIGFVYPDNQRISLDLLMAKLYFLNSATLMSMEQLHGAELVGDNKMIDEILMEFSHSGPIS